MTDAQGGLARTPTDEEAWQQSMACYWADLEAGVGGVVAFGAWPNRGQGVTWFGVVDWGHGVGVQRDHGPFPIDPADRTAHLLACGSVRVEAGADGVVRLRAEDEGTGTRLELELDDDHPMSPYPQAASATIASQARGHLEASGRARGRLVLDGREIDVAPRYQRDTSWGPRDTVPVTSYSWSVGSCGERLSWSALVLDVQGLGPVATAFVATGGELRPARDVRTLVTVDHDALTVRGWTTTLALEGGAVVRIEAEPLGHLLDHRPWPDVVATDTIGRAVATVDGAPLDGFAALNRIVNPRLGTAVPTTYLGGSPTPGHFTFPPRE